MSRVKDPREKKRLSLKRDRRNTYGENDKASRKNISRAKSRVNRAYRRAGTTFLNDASGVPDDVAIEVAEQALLSRRRKVWRKTPDLPLGEVLSAKEGGGRPPIS